MKGIIYKITNTVNGKIYIGKTVQNIKRRFSQHIAKAKNDQIILKNIRLYSAFRKYGFDKFVIETIDEVDIKMLNNREQYWISYYDSTNKEIGYNLTGGGDGGGIMLECTKKKIIETKRKKGTLKHSEKTKEKISIANKGKPKSEEHKKHLSEHHHLKTTHILIFKDGHTETSRESIENLAKRLNVTTVRLRRASEVGEFRCGEFYLLDLTNLSQAFNRLYRYSKEKIVIDPIKKDIVSTTTIRARRQHNMNTYKNIDIYNYIFEKQQEKEKFIEYYNNLKKETLERNTHNEQTNTTFRTNH